MTIYDPIQINGDNIEFYGEVIGKYTAPIYMIDDIHREAFFTDEDISEAYERGCDDGKTKGLSEGGQDMAEMIRAEIDLNLDSALEGLDDAIQVKITLAINEALEEAERRFKW